MYSSPYDVRLALTPGADSADKETASGLSDGQLSDAIAEADGIIDLYISQWYTIPTNEQTVEIPGSPPTQIQVTVAPMPVRGMSRSIAAFLATLTFRKHKDLPEEDPVRLRYNLVMEMLRALRDRESFLDPDVFLPVEDANTDQGAHVENLYEGKLFGPEDYRVLAPYPGRPSTQVLWPSETW